MNLTQMFNEALADTKGFFSDPKGFFVNSRAAFFALLGAMLLDLAVLLFIVMAIGGRLDWSGGLLLPLAGLGLLSLVVAFGILVWQAIVGARSYALLSAIVAGLMLLVPIFHVVRAAGLPPIHDISTDLRNPPRFVKIKELRPAGANALDRKAPKDLKKLQRRAYPKVKTARFGNIHAGRVFEAVRAVAYQQGWALVSIEPQRGAIEATDTSLLMGFKDDIVIRVREGKQSPRKRGRSKRIRNRVYVDVRSVSRLGRSDLGVNARRIKAFLADLKQEVKKLRKNKKK